METNTTLPNAEDEGSLTSSSLIVVVTKNILSPLSAKKRTISSTTSIVRDGADEEGAPAKVDATDFATGREQHAQVDEENELFLDLPFHMSELSSDCSSHNEEASWTSSLSLSSHTKNNHHRNREEDDDDDRWMMEEGLLQPEASTNNATYYHHLSSLRSRLLSASSALTIKRRTTATNNSNSRSTSVDSSIQDELLLLGESPTSKSSNGPSSKKSSSFWMLSWRYRMGFAVLAMTLIVCNSTFSSLSSRSQQKDMRSSSTKHDRSETPPAVASSVRRLPHFDNPTVLRHNAASNATTNTGSGSSSLAFAMSVESRPIFAGGSNHSSQEPRPPLTSFMILWWPAGLAMLCKLVEMISNTHRCSSGSSSGGGILMKQQQEHQQPSQDIDVRHKRRRRRNTVVTTQW